MNWFCTLVFLGLAVDAKAPLRRPSMRRHYSASGSLAMDKDASIIPDSYIVRLKASEQCAMSSDQEQCHRQLLEQHTIWLMSVLIGDDTKALSSDSANPPLNELRHVYSANGFHGYAGKFGVKVLDQIRGRPEVAYVEHDSIMHIADYQLLKPATEQERRLHHQLRSRDDQRKSAKFEEKESIKKKDVTWGQRTIQRNAPWGLCRLSNKRLPRVFKRYAYPQSAGMGVDAYIIDTGINVEHVDFEGRAQWGTTTPFDDEDIDGNGHGTHVAGTIGGKLYGVAKKATVIAVKVLRTSGFGSNSDVIKGVEWVSTQHRKNLKRGKKFRGSVANMSLGGGKSTALEDMVDEAVRAGVHFAVAAGNDGDDACDYSPAAAKLPLTVGAINRDDEMAFFSNRGRCVDILAPGVDIVSAWIGSPFAVNTISGTSMATPHIVGVLALHVSELHGDDSTDEGSGIQVTPEQVKKIILDKATKDIISKIPDSDGDNHDGDGNGDDSGPTPNVLVNTEYLLKGGWLWSAAHADALIAVSENHHSLNRHPLNDYQKSTIGKVKGMNKRRIVDDDVDEQLLVVI
jgi:cerevisin